MEKTTILDVRGLSHEEKHERIFPAVDGLVANEVIQISFDFAPLPLIHVFEANPSLRVVEERSGPPTWILSIRKIDEVAGNRSATKDELKQLLRDLKEEGVGEASKQRAKNLLREVDATTLGLLEQELIREGVTHDEIRKNLCDIHLEALHDALVEKRIEVSPPHPIHTLMEEHRLILDGLHRLNEILPRIGAASEYDQLEGELEILEEVSHLMVEAELHHQREEDALFPRLAEHDVTEPPAIMAEDHVEFRSHKRALYAAVNAYRETPFDEFRNDVISHGEFITRELESHIFKEDNILYQIALQVLTDEDWKRVKRDCDKIGYCCFKPQDQTAVIDLDIRSLPAAQRHSQIFDRWNAIKPGEVLRLINDHDPKPLYYQFEAEQRDRFEWEYEQQGDDAWIVRIRRR